MSACIIRRRSDGLYRSRVKAWWSENKHWTDDIKKARIFTNVGHAKVSLRNEEGVLNIDSNSLRSKIVYTCENCCASKYHFCKKHTEMFKLLKKWLTKAIDNNFHWTYDVLPVEVKIPEVKGV